MLRYLLRRLAISAITVLGLALVVFLVVRILPGDAAAARLGPEASQGDIDALRAEYGLDQPIIVQLGRYLFGLLQGDLGTAVSTGRPVADELFARLPASIELAVAGLLVALLIGFPLGMLAAAHRGRIPDVVARIFAVLGSSMAPVWLGLLLIFGLYSLAHLFPGPVGRLPIGMPPPPHITGSYVLDGLLTGQFAVSGEALRYLALPALTLGLGASAAVLKMVRSAMIATHESGFVRTAIAYGVPGREVLWRDQLRNAMLQVLTAIGLVFGFLLGGNVIVERLFSWPGVGRIAFDALGSNDLELLQGYALIIGVMYITLNFVVDLLYGVIDPRIRLGGRAS
ncbi:ABC transporter permease [Leifsonia sp. H3M29-4]|uniref:ABC transporter permease n=1 Tax=Salinibacterium metalliresistens TaxID=3031321 RepID=UPI0023DB4DAD|nr:ABC transporter permease [Salinibacterium metalliresistens]MDF1479395.1 ABC transporter permease [Salinibacterium metalliresistens]